MNNPTAMTSWLVLGPIWNGEDQNDNHGPDDGHPTAAAIIRDIDHNLLVPTEITRSPELAPKEGDSLRYGNKKIFHVRTCYCRALNFSHTQWESNGDVQDNIHQYLGSDDNPEEHHNFEGKHHALAFFLVYIHSPDARQVKLRVRSDDALRVWLNGLEIQKLAYLIDRDITPQTEETCCEIPLLQGQNILLAAVAETHYEWGFSARLESAEGLVFSVEPIMQVQGHVRSTDGNPYVNARVKVFDKDLRSEELLGETSTDASGHYLVSA